MMRVRSAAVCFVLMALGIMACVICSWVPRLSAPRLNTLETALLHQYCAQACGTSRCRIAHEPEQTIVYCGVK